MTRLEYFLNRNVNKLLGLCSFILGLASLLILLLCLLTKGT